MTVYLITYEGDEPRALGGYPFRPDNALLVDDNAVAQSGWSGTPREFVDDFVRKWSDTQDPAHWTLTAYSFKTLDDALKAIGKLSNGTSGALSDGSEVKVKAAASEPTPNVPPSPYPAGVPLDPSVTAKAAEDAAPSVGVATTTSGSTG